MPLLVAAGIALGAMTIAADSAEAAKATKACHQLPWPAYLQALGYGSLAVGVAAMLVWWVLARAAVRRGTRLTATGAGKVAAAFGVVGVFGVLFEAVVAYAEQSTASKPYWQCSGMALRFLGLG